MKLAASILRSNGITKPCYSSAGTKILQAHYLERQSTSPILSSISGSNSTCASPTKAKETRKSELDEAMLNILLSKYTNSKGVKVICEPTAAPLSGNSTRPVKKRILSEGIQPPHSRPPNISPCLNNNPISTRQQIYISHPDRENMIVVEGIASVSWKLRIGRLGPLCKLGTQMILISKIWENAVP